MPDSYTSTLNLDDAAAMIRSAGRVLVTTHAKPDGDAFGSVVALTAALRTMGHRAEAVLMPPVPATFSQLRGNDISIVLQPNVALPPADLVLILDTGAWSQIAPIRDRLTPLLPRTLIIDHHLSGDVGAGHRFIDSSAAATCEIVAQLIDRLHEMLRRDTATVHPFNDPIVADSIYTGIASDTGWFRYSNTRPQTLELAARLLRAGVDHARLFQLLEQNERPEKLALLARALASLRIVSDGRAALMVLTADDFVQTGTGADETERFVDLPQLVGSVQVVALVTQVPGDHGSAKPQAASVPPPPGLPTPPVPPVRVSFRSKPGPGAIDVNAMAKAFGGGGHSRAAGAKVQAPLSQVVTQVAETLERAIGG